MISWKNNNHNWIAYNFGRIIGQVSQNPPNIHNAGFWVAAFRTSDGDIETSKAFKDIKNAMDALEEATKDLVMDDL